MILSEIRQQVIDEAMTWLRTPYMSHQRVKGAGVDCAMFPLAVYAAVGLVQIPDPVLKYSPYWHLHRSEEMYLEWIVKLGGVEIDAPQPADFAVFRQPPIPQSVKHKRLDKQQENRPFSHGAIVIDWPNCIHSRIGMGVLLDDLSKGKIAEGERKYFTLVKDNV